MVAEAGHLVVGADDTADVVLADGDGPRPKPARWSRLGGTGDATRRAVAARRRQPDRCGDTRGFRRLIVRLPDAMDSGFGAMRETDGHTLLTPRELEVLATLAEGMTNKAIARRLDISLHTVKFHVESLFRKLGARTRTEAVAKASKHRRHETITL